MKYKLLVIDVDGTLIDDRGQIDARDVKAINNATSQGVTVALSTGRVPIACRQVLGELGLDGYHIFFDGALVCNPDINDTIYSQSIQSDNVLKAVDYARNNDIYLELYTRDKFYTDQTNWTDEIHRKFFGVSIYRDDLTKIGSLQPILKMETIARAAEEFIKAEKMKLALGTCLRFSTARSPAFPEIDFVNIIEPGVSKGSALLKLADYLGVDLEEVIAVGDGYNDIPLLQTAGFGVAMGNAFAEVKAVADDITLTVGQGGVASVIDRHILGRTG